MQKSMQNSLAEVSHVMHITSQSLVLMVQTVHDTFTIYMQDHDVVLSCYLSLLESLNSFALVLAAFGQSILWFYN